MEKMNVTLGLLEGLDKEDMMELMMDGIRYRKIKESLNADDVEGVVEKITEALGRMNSLVHRIRNLRAPAAA